MLAQERVAIHVGWNLCMDRLLWQTNVASAAPVQEQQQHTIPMESVNRPAIE